ncbi:hypothetical protein B0T19DRAFT_198515 [Cercophora scortea]|uniref:MARVEL domain-containing protein n=1 Tax=Cercophora scortea TaxID=314031 RepID=A0AAE0IDR6_9PEZI|nr:hypothetical protein B0T19DRAFT_198515 [Cercophora scortea]
MDAEEHTKGTSSRALHVFFRLGELVCACIVVGLLGRFFFLIDEAGSDPNARLVYAMVIGSLTILFSLVFIPPLAYAFWSFPLDFFLFAAWLVVFCLLETLTGINTCNAFWFNVYWGYYWGRWYRPGINWSGCSAYRTVLAFSFIASFTYLLSFCLGLYWVMTYSNIKERRNRGFGYGKNRGVEKNGVANGTGAANAGGTGQGVVEAPPATTGQTTADPSTRV